LYFVFSFIIILTVLQALLRRLHPRPKASAAPLLPASFPFLALPFLLYQKKKKGHAAAATTVVAVKAIGYRYCLSPLCGENCQCSVSVVEHAFATEQLAVLSCFFTTVIAVVATVYFDNQTVKRRRKRQDGAELAEGSERQQAREVGAAGCAGDW
jgi:FtsH-binding integral membrane protein